MPKFLLQVTFNQEAAKRLIEDGGTKRAAAVQELLKQQEARLESLYFSPQNAGRFRHSRDASRWSRRPWGYRSRRQDCGDYVDRQENIYSGRVG